MFFYFYPTNAFFTLIIHFHCFFIHINRTHRHGLQTRLIDLEFCPNQPVQQTIDDVIFHVLDSSVSLSCIPLRSVGPTFRPGNIITCLDALSLIIHRITHSLFQVGSTMLRVQCTHTCRCLILIRNKNRILLSSQSKAPPDFPHVTANHLIAFHVCSPSHLGRSKTCGPHTLAPPLPTHYYIYE